MKSNPPNLETPAGLLLKGEGGRGLRAILGGLSVDTLQWSLGLLSAGIGAFMLVAPHQFEIPPYAFLLPYLAGWGLVGLAAGIALLSVPVTRPSPTTTAVIQGVVGLALLGLAFGFARAGAWTGVAFYLTLGLGTPFAWDWPGVRQGRQGCHGRRVRGPCDSAGDFLALLLGIGATLAGLVILVTASSTLGSFPGQRAVIPYLGGIWLVTGPLLVRAQVRPLSRREKAISHLLAGLSLLAFGLLVALPGRAWTGIGIYFGLGLVVTLLRPQLPQLPCHGQSTLR